MIEIMTAEIFGDPLKSHAVLCLFTEINDVLVTQVALCEHHLTNHAITLNALEGWYKQYCDAKHKIIVRKNVTDVFAVPWLDADRFLTVPEDQ